MRPRRFFRLGATIWIVGGAGHLLLIDLLTLALQTGPARFVRHAEVLATMTETPVRFGWLGQTTAYRMLAGFSVWVALSLAFLGTTYLILSAQPAVRLRPFAVLGTVVSAVFLGDAVACMILPPMIGAALATLAFASSLLGKEQ